MIDLNMTDFTTQINTHKKALEALSEKLHHIHQLIHFTLNADMTNLKPGEIHAQLVSISDCVEEAEKFNQTLQAQLATLDGTTPSNTPLDSKAE